MRFIESLKQKKSPAQHSIIKSLEEKLEAADCQNDVLEHHLTYCRKKLENIELQLKDALNENIKLRYKLLQVLKEKGDKDAAPSE